MLVFRHHDLIYSIVFLVLDENVPFIKLWLLIHHDEGSLNRLLEAYVGRLECHLSICSRLAEVIHCGSSRVTANLGAGFLYHVKHLFDTNELTSVLIKRHSDFLKATSSCS